MRRLAAIALLLLGACGEDIDTTGLPSVADYDTWHRIDVTGPAPGHGDTYRIIYVNEAARGYDGGRYVPGSVLVKEIRTLGGDGQPGELDYIAIMRKLPPGADLPIDRGWLFTRAHVPGGQETHDDFCWGACHAQGPIDGAWYDYGR